ncbi:MAG: BsaWI family type II restriction enzyme [Candidatus Jacksonbacteria bacterium]
MIKKAKDSLKTRHYWEPTRKQFYKKLKEIEKKHKISRQKALIIILDYLDEVLKASENAVMRVARKTGKDLKQVRVSVAGNNYQALVAFALMENVLASNLSRLHIIVKPKQHPIIKEYGIIKIGGETQKPDMDILIYSDKPKSPLVICSCKTSLRERAGQTYRWKLLLDLATANPQHLKKYPDCPINRLNIQYKKDREVFVIMVTADFYDETNQPQQMGMFKFFDGVFVSKQTKTRIKKLSEIIEWLNKLY